MRKLTVLGFSVGIGVLAALVACSKPTGTLDSAARNLGVADTKSLSYSGTGRWFQFGQAPVPGKDWPAFDVSAFTTDVSFDPAAARVQMTRLQQIDPARKRPAPVEQKADQYVSGGYAWNMTNTAQAQPGAVDERTAEIWTTPQGFIKAAEANKADVKPANGGSEVSFTAGKTRYVGTINAKDEVEKVTTWLDFPVIGDTPVEFTYTDYRDFNGVKFPGHIVRTQGGFPVLDITVATVAKNPQVAITAPDDVKNFTPPPVNVAVQELAKGVYFIGGGSHNSLAIDQSDHIVIVEGPLNEARSDAVIAKAKELIPGKPIKYVINTHVHFDHSGGLRSYVNEGATIVTHEVNKPYYETVFANPHTINPDHLAGSAKKAAFETVGDKYVLNDPQHTIELHLIAGSGHVDGFLMVYLPAEKILVEGDAYTPSAPDVTPPTPSPYTVNLNENIERLGLDVATIAPIHGRVATYADLRREIGLPPPAPPAKKR